jgi:hypothetical protein
MWCCQPWGPASTWPYWGSAGMASNCGHVSTETTGSRSSWNFDTSVRQLRWWRGGNARQMCCAAGGGMVLAVYFSSSHRSVHGAVATWQPLNTWLGGAEAAEASQDQTPDHRSRTNFWLGDSLGQLGICKRPTITSRFRTTFFFSPIQTAGLSSATASNKRQRRVKLNVQRQINRCPGRCFLLIHLEIAWDLLKAFQMLTNRVPNPVTKVPFKVLDSKRNWQIPNPGRDRKIEIRYGNSCYGNCCYGTSC